MRAFKLCSLLLILILVPVITQAQLVKYEPSRTPTAKKESMPNARRHAVNPVSLPFWDDFSTVKGHSADSMLWINNDKVFINNGQAINPPSINVASFDGYNASGLPYNMNEHTAVGYGDTLETQPIRMGDVAPADRNNIFLSFFYQAGGNSEPPNASDFLRLQLRSTEGWVDTLTFYIGNDFDPSVFHEVALQINKPKYFHNEFQFRFIFFGTLSGAYDSWHLDYVYLNKRTFNDRNTNISDRTITKPVSSVLGDYYAIPYSHFITNPDGLFTKPHIELFNLKDTSFSQVINYTSHFTITNYTGTTPVVAFNNFVDNPAPLPSLPSRGRATHQLQNLPSTTYFNPTADSASIVVQVGFNSGDNNNDYFSRYIPISFLSNDTVQHEFTLSKYYAYDDGTAEYAAGLSQQGNQFAYRFVMQTTAVDTLNGVFFYFPYFGGASPATTQLFVMKDKNGLPDSENLLYDQAINITKTTNSQFTFYKFNEGILVRDTFYIGYREPRVTSDPNSRIRIGLDASHDTGHQMFYRANELSAWILNTDLSGSLMIRPHFGKGDVVTSVNEPREAAIVYPNPNRGEFFVKGRAEKISVLSGTGQAVGFTIEHAGDLKKVSIRQAAPGLYFIRYSSGMHTFTEKIIVTY